jgi:hypothetical protein
MEQQALFIFSIRSWVNPHRRWGQFIFALCSYVNPHQRWGQFIFAACSCVNPHQRWGAVTFSQGVHSLRRRPPITDAFFHYLQKYGVPDPCFSIHPRDRHDRLSFNPHTTREIRPRKHSNSVEFLASRATDYGSLSPTASLV